MSNTRRTTKTAIGFAAAIPAFALVTPVEASAQASRVPTQYGATQVETSGPITTPPLSAPALPPLRTTTNTTINSIAQPTFTEERSIGPDGVETITRTRRIIRSTPNPNPVQPTPPVATTPYPIAPAPLVFEREQWLAECNRRTAGRSVHEKGGIIGGLLGAIGGGIAGNVIAGAGEWLAGTLIGGGVGTIAGLLLGNLIGGGKKGDRYDCEAALDGYLAQYGQPGAARAIYPYPPAGYGYGYTGQYGYSQACGCQQPQIALIPIRSQVRQRVIERENVTERLVPGTPVAPPPLPGPRPSPKLIKQ